jgi:hypothetical protein
MIEGITKNPGNKGLNQIGLRGEVKAPLSG